MEKILYITLGARDFSWAVSAVSVKSYRSRDFGLWLTPKQPAAREKKKTLAQSNLHVYIRTEWRKLLDSMRMPCRPPFYPYKPLQFCKHSKSFQNPWNVSLFENSAELSSPVSFTQQPLLW